MEKSEVGKIVVSVWIHKLGISRPAYHSNDFNGNMCKLILTNVDVLYRIIIDMNAHEIMPYLSAFKSFDDVRISCFGNDLLPDFEKRIAIFHERYLLLGISVTPAVHVLYCHVVQFCKFFKSALGRFSEQASESVHHDFYMMWSSSGKVDTSNMNYENNLFKAVLRYNGRHLSV